MKHFLKRGAAHARRHFWQYGLGAVVAAAALTWGTTRLCEWAESKARDFRQHYRQSETNTASICELREKYCSVTNRMRRIVETNRLQQAEIDALTQTNKDLKFWVRKLQK